MIGVLVLVQWGAQNESKPATQLENGSLRVVVFSIPHVGSCGPSAQCLLFTVTRVRECWPNLVNEPHWEAGVVLSVYVAQL